MNALMTLTMMFSLNVIKTTGDCPRYCECKWKSGKESVLCANANMTEIPRHLDSGTQLLDLSGNRLQSIGPDEFFNASLLNLQKLFLSRCRLRFMEKSSFRKIINLVELDLSYNELHSVPSHTFEFIGELRELRLNGNPIIRVLNNAFRMVPRLTKLDLSECRIGYVEIKAFQGLETSLEWLKLDKNKIVNIKSYALVNLGNLHGLELSGNPWNCSCGLRTLREWMLRRNVPYSIPPVCKYPPRLADKDWDKLDLDEFACVPRTEAIAPRAAGEEGANVTLGCFVDGTPDPTVRWLRKNHLVGNSTSPSTSIPGEKSKIYLVRVAKETSNLTILAADVEDTGIYLCRAENKAGKSESNVALTITASEAARIWSSRMVAAVGLVFLLFALAVALLTFCAWSSRKRKLYFRHPGENSVNGEGDGYEMNHKKPINFNKIVNNGNHHCGSNADSLRDGGISGKTYRSESSGEKSAENFADDNKGTESCGGLRTYGDPVRHEKLRIQMNYRLSESEDSRFGPSSDLHIPRLPERETNNCSPPCGWPNEKPSTMTSAMASSASFRSFDGGVDSRSTPADAIPPSRNVCGKYPDLLELSRTAENIANNNAFCTVPRKKSCRIRKGKEGGGHESQSPLLPGSYDDNYSPDTTKTSPPDLNGGRNSSCSSLPADAFNRAASHLDDFPKTVRGKSRKSEKYSNEKYCLLEDGSDQMKESRENEKSRFWDDNVSLGKSHGIRHFNSPSPSFDSKDDRKIFDFSNFPQASEINGTREEDNNNSEYNYSKAKTLRENVRNGISPYRNCSWTPGGPAILGPPFTEQNEKKLPFCQS